jgi:D-amino peptidase
MTRVFVSVDLEGVAGVTTFDQIVRGGSGYPRAQELMTEEANAAIRGAFAAGATEVRVGDSHGTMDNLLADRLDPRARLVSGAPRDACMVSGLESGDAVAIFVGYHAGAGSRGVLSHTFSSNYTEVRLNGQAVTEAEVNGLYAASLGVPVGAVTGDDEICDVARKAFPGVLAVEVKRSLGFSAADSLSPAVAHEAIETAVSASVAAAAAGELTAPAIAERYVLETDFTLPLMADYASNLPGAVRVSGRTLRVELDSISDVIGALMAWYYAAAQGAQQHAAIAHRR